MPIKDSIMINGVLEYLNTSWGDRIGKGMNVKSEEGIESTILAHKQKDPNTIITTLSQNGKPYQTVIYEAYNSGMLRSMTYQKIGKNPHWIYEYDMVGETLRVTRTDPKGKKISYDMYVTKYDSDGRILVAEYQLVGTNESFGVINCERDLEGKLIKEIFTYRKEKRIDHLDKKGRYLKMEFFNEENLFETIEYLH